MFIAHSDFLETPKFNQISFKNLKIEASNVTKDPILAWGTPKSFYYALAIPYYLCLQDQRKCSFYKTQGGILTQEYILDYPSRNIIAVLFPGINDNNSGKNPLTDDDNGDIRYTNSDNPNLKN